jgi:hypothetical protein
MVLLGVIVSPARNSVATEKRGRAKIPSPQPPSFLPARAEKFLFLPREARQSEFAVRIFAEKGSDFNQKAPPVGKRRVWFARFAEASARRGGIPPAEPIGRKISSPRKNLLRKFNGAGIFSNTYRIGDFSFA